MGHYEPKDATSSRGVTLNCLKGEMHSLSMRLLLAMQDHDQEAQEAIKKQMMCVQDEIDRMRVGGLRREGARRQFISAEGRDGNIFSRRG